MSPLVRRPAQASIAALLFALPVAVAAPGERLEAELSGGARLLLEPRPSARQAELVIAWRGGWLTDDPDVARAARALAPCAPEVDRRAFLEDAARRGVPFRFEVEPDLTVLRAGGGPDEVLALFDRVTEWMRLAPYESDATVEAGSASPHDELRRAAARAWWEPGSALARPAPTGGVTREQLVAAHRRRIGSDTMVIGLRGPYEPQTTGQRLADRVAGVPKVAANEVHANARMLRPHGLEAWIDPNEDTGRATIAWVCPGPRPSDDAEPAATLWRMVVERRIGEAVAPFGGRALPETGSFAQADREHPLLLLADVPKERTKDALVALHAAIARALGDAPPTDEELHAFTRQARVMADAIDRLPDGAIELATRHAALGFAHHRFEKRLTALANATVDGVAAAGRRFASVEHAFVVLRGPAAEMLAAWSAARTDLVPDGDAAEPKWLAVPPMADDVQERVDAVLAALGGRERWAAVAGLSSTLRFQAGNRAIESRYLRDLARFRLRAESIVAGTSQTTVVDVDASMTRMTGWRTTPTGVIPLPRDQLEVLVGGEQRSYPRLVPRLARGEVWARAGEGGALVLADVTGDLGVLEIAPDGRPKLLRWPHADGERRTEYDEWAESGGLVYPRRYRVVSDAPIEYESLRFEPGPAPADEDFRPPR